MKIIFKNNNNKFKAFSGSCCENIHTFKYIHYIRCMRHNGNNNKVVKFTGKYIKLEFQIPLFIERLKIMSQDSEKYPYAMENPPETWHKNIQDMVLILNSLISHFLKVRDIRFKSIKSLKEFHKKLQQLHLQINQKMQNKYLPLADIRLKTTIKENLPHIFVNTVHARTPSFDSLEETNKLIIMIDTIQIIESFLNSIILTYKNNPENTWKNWKIVAGREPKYKLIKKEMVYQAANYYFKHAAFFEKQLYILGNGLVNNPNKNRKFTCMFIVFDMQQKWEIFIYPLFSGYITTIYNYIPENIQQENETFELEDVKEEEKNINIQQIQDKEIISTNKKQEKNNNIENKLEVWTGKRSFSTSTRVKHDFLEKLDQSYKFHMAINVLKTEKLKFHYIIKLQKNLTKKKWKIL